MNLYASSLTIYVIVTFISSLSFFLAHPDDFILPPYFNDEQKFKCVTLIEKDRGLDLFCNFSDNLNYEVQWFKDNVNLENNAKHLSLPPSDDLNGLYWCTVKNNKGTSRSCTHEVRKVFAETNIKTEVFDCAYGQYEYLVLQKQPIRSYPKGSYTWVKNNNSSTSRAEKIIDNSNTYTDAEGNLHLTMFSWYNNSEATYVVNVHHTARTAVTTGIRYYKMVNRKDQKVPHWFTVLKYHPNKVVMRGDDAILECFFYLGDNEQNSVTWRKQGQSKDSLLKANYGNSKWRATIMNAQKKDEGEYICSVGSVEGSVMLTVNESPYFHTPDFHPRNQNVTEGDNARVPCKVSGSPPLQIQWYINQRPIHENEPGISFMTNKNELLVRNVCANCTKAARKTDSMVVSCEAKNDYGFIVASGYINVLKRTIVTVDNAQLVEFDTASSEGWAEWNCSVSQDVLTPTTVVWRRLVEDDFGPVPLKNDGEGLYLEGSYLKLSVGEDSERNWNFYKGIYECYADNGYSTSSVKVHVAVRFDNAAMAMTSRIWWVVLLFLIILFVLVLLLVACCLYSYYNKEFTYYVDLHERMNGNDPVKELKDSQFADYTRKEVYGSKHTLNSVEEDEEEEPDSHDNRSN